MTVTKNIGMLLLGIRAGRGKLDKDISDKSALKYEGIRHRVVS